MTDSLGETRAVLTMVVEHLVRAQHCAGTARAHIDDALGMLGGLDRRVCEAPLSGPGTPGPRPLLRRAIEELDRGLGLMGAGAEVVAQIDARL